MRKSFDSIDIFRSPLPIIYRQWIHWETLSKNVQTPPKASENVHSVETFFFIEGFPNDDGDDDDDDDDDDGNLVFALPTSTMYITIACTS